MILLLSALSFAHHDTVVTRVGASPGASAASLAVPLPRAEIGLSSSLDRFSRVLWEGDLRAQKLEQGATLGTLTPSVGLRIKSQTAFVVALPVGQVFYSDGRQDRGLGDLNLAVAQSLGPKKGPWSLDLQVGLSAPTGVYRQESTYSVTTVLTPENGQASVFTSDSRISLGMGSFAVSASGAARLEAGRNTLILSGSLSQPVGWTPDQIWWGQDFSVAAGGLHAVGKKQRLLLGGTLLGAAHTQNRILADESESSAEVLRSGARQELAVNGVATLQVRERLGCGVALQVPVIQHADSIQLVRGTGVSTQCGLGLSAAK